MERESTRKPWLAGLLAAFCPGLGHLYGGWILPAIILCWLPRLLLIGAFGLSVIWGAAVLPVIVGGVLYGGLYVTQIVSAIMRARQAGSSYALKRCNHAVVYFGFILFAWLISESMGAFAKKHVVELFKVPSAAMLPSVLVGDHVLVAKLGDINRRPARGDVVVLRAPDREVNYIKRVVGLAGDEVAFVSGVLHVNGRPVERSLVGRRRFSDRVAGRWAPVELQVYEEKIDRARFLTAQQDETRPMPDFGPLRVPEGSFFVLGDYRDNSLDSRIFGAVPIANFLGTARLLLFSYGEGGPRLERIGLQL